MRTKSQTIEITARNPEELATIGTALELAQYFIKNGHDANDLRSAIRTTMHIRLED
ncbi:hypothetical protein PMG71_05790 [Roseofilum sp. BLCC_M154]|uniref:Uncharacterized protein n=1 Tax=Roseofilum acuticapitatum BLCC-M154 TaxID=3022444 RepID=A0ABT7APV9_9CYAN|nr:hypothetical protein [Roseofilum acuticapitatum]MDJ1168932.1 hypothetical protein [Roseofilum acuticapitatum BLCC-M154]